MRAVNTVLMVCAMAFGIVIAMRLLTVEDVVIDKKFSELSMVPHDSYLVYAIAAAIAAMGFSMLRWAVSLPFVRVTLSISSWVTDR